MKFSWNTIDHSCGYKSQQLCVDKILIGTFICHAMTCAHRKNSTSVCALVSKKHVFDQLTRSRYMRDSKKYLHGK